MRTMIAYGTREPGDDKITIKVQKRSLPIGVQRDLQKTGRLLRKLGLNPDRVKIIILDKGGNDASNESS